VVGQRQRHDGGVELALAQQFQQLDREIFLQHSGICGTLSIRFFTSGGSR
jgi:hypothetical protein